MPLRRRRCAASRSAAIAAWQASITRSIAAKAGARRNWEQTKANMDFRQWQTQLTLPSPGNYSLLTRCTNSNGVAQPDSPNWNPAGFMRNVVESVDILAV